MLRTYNENMDAPPKLHPLSETSDGAPNKLDENTLRSFWQDEWVDDVGRHWQVNPLGAEVGAEGTYGFCEGQVRCNGAVAGQWNRTVELAWMQESVTHGKLIIDPAFQGQGFASAWLERCAQKYEEWNLRRIDVETGHSGLSAWPRMGFDLASADDRNSAGPCAYAQSDYASAMRTLLDDLAANLSLVPAAQRLPAARELNQMERLVVPRIPYLAESYPQLLRLLGEGVQARLTATPAGILEWANARKVDLAPKLDFDSSHHSL